MFTAHACFDSAHVKQYCDSMLPMHIIHHTTSHGLFPCQHLCSVQHHALEQLTLWLACLYGTVCGLLDQSQTTSLDGTYTLWFNVFCHCAWVGHNSSMCWLKNPSKSRGVGGGGGGGEKEKQEGGGGGGGGGGEGCVPASRSLYPQVLVEAFQCYCRLPRVHVHVVECEAPATLLVISQVQVLVHIPPHVQSSYMTYHCLCPTTTLKSFIQCYRNCSQTICCMLPVKAMHACTYIHICQCTIHTYKWMGMYVTVHASIIPHAVEHTVYTPWK